MKLSPIALNLAIAYALPVYTANAADEDVNKEATISQIETITVTATKRVQNLQKVPMSITAFGGDALSDRVIEDIADLQFSVPNFVSDGVRVSIRGISNNASSSSAEDGLGYHANGVYVNKPLINSTDYFDIERIEVLRGPQGTLYGRNTTAGVINIISRKPHEDFGGYLSITLGNYNSKKIKGALNLPISDTVGQRFAFSTLKRDGYTDNIYQGGNKDVDGRDNYELRSTTSFNPSDDFSANLVLSYLKEDSDRQSETKGTCNSDPVLGCSPIGKLGFNAPDLTSSIWQTINKYILPSGPIFPTEDYFAGDVNPNGYRTVNIDIAPSTKVEQKAVSLELTYDVGDYTISSLTGYYKTYVAAIRDFDRFATDVRMFQPLTYRANGKDFITTDKIISGRRDVADSEQVSQEFQLLSNYKGDFNFLLGLYYFDEERYSQVAITHPSLAAAQQQYGMVEDAEFFNVQSYIDTTSYALFGEVYYDLSEQTTLTAGLRYTDDEKNITQQQLFFTFVQSFDEWITANNDWQETTGKLAINHIINDNSIVYASYSTGYKAGGVNPGADVNFDPEFIDSFEIGTKNLFMDGRLQANLGAFYYDYKDMQIGQVSETSTKTVNADAKVVGAEAEFVFAATPDLIFDLSISVLDFKIKDFESAQDADPNGIAPGTVPALDEDGNIRYAGNNMIKNLDGNSVRNAPPFSLKIGMEYEFNVTDGYDMTARIDHFYQDGYYASEYNKPSDEIESWSQTDAQLILRPDSEDWLVKLFIKNISDNDDIIRIGQEGPLVGNFRSVTVMEPRTFGIEFKYLFE